MSREMCVRVRFVLSGACHPSYSGRQVQLEVPLAQENGAPTTTAHIKSLIRRDWPSDLSEMRDTINTAELKILKTGNLLADDTPLRSVLTAAEAQDCRLDAPSAPQDGEEPKSVLMHLVLQKNSGLVKRDKEGDKPGTSKRSEVRPSDSGCCRLM
ncbi:hypothetical protein DQ04_02541110 [Trypanosoma grayi]|uniref:hypothetical protein n=1 Tax=Trypanosoma grayi TaxID=71804 RepID=UPI0004F47741|nr:hypothetical protein DQ04_02541110 [Trypanosoma grayi]KEG11522.1 hypothetical protein DQ04_02541110 [Trypanosoma grayi]